jgi:hypothetical protein
MNLADVLQWLKSFINDENIIKIFEGNIFYFFFIQRVFTEINTCTS